MESHAEFSGLYDYRILLRSELAARKRRNASYSLRGMALQLGVSAAYLSQVFSGRRLLTEATGLRFARSLRWNRQRRKVFLQLVRLERARDGESRKLILDELAGAREELAFLDLRLAEFELVANPLHFLLLELTGVSGFSPDPKWLAKRLGVTAFEARQAVERLLRLGLLEEQGGRLRKRIRHYRIGDMPSHAIRHFHRRHLQGALAALDAQPSAERDITGTTMAFEREKIGEVKDLIREFRGRLNALASAQANPDSVYQLSVQFFRLDKGGGP